MPCEVGARAEGVVTAGELASGGMMSVGGRCVEACLQALRKLHVGRERLGKAVWGS